jgi:hypothetical protein
MASAAANVLGEGNGNMKESRGTFTLTFRSIGAVALSVAPATTPNRAKLLASKFVSIMTS